MSLMSNQENGTDYSTDSDKHASRWMGKICLLNHFKFGVMKQLSTDYAEKDADYMQLISSNYQGGWLICIELLRAN